MRLFHPSFSARPALAAVFAGSALLLAACGGEGSDLAAPSPSEAAPTEEASPTPSEPTDADAPAEVPAQGDCTAAGLDGDAEFSGVGGEVASSAQFLLDAAVRCDEQALFTVAEESGTRLTFGDVSPSEFFSLPEDVDPDGLGHYEVIARLLAGTTASPDPDNDLIVWPAVFHAPEVEANWDELVDAGLYTPEQVERLQSGDLGYLGWRLGIRGDGSLAFIVAGD